MRDGLLVGCVFLAGAFTATGAVVLGLNRLVYGRWLR